MLQDILFTDIINVDFMEMRQMKFIKIALQKDKSLSFYAESYSSTLQWHTFCGLLFTIPKYAIPEIPKENTSLYQGIHQYSNLHKGDLR